MMRGHTTYVKNNYLCKNKLKVYYTIDATIL